MSVQFLDTVVRVAAYLDTGFSGVLSLPPDLVSADLPRDGETQWILADDREVRSPYVMGLLAIPEVGLRLSAAITLIGTVPIAGRQLSDRLRITLDHGRELIIEP